MVTLVENLVRCYSPSGYEENAVSFFLSELTKRGFQVHRDDAGNAIGVIGQGPVRVYLVGHIDTVSGEIPVHVDRGKLFGRGSVDAKGALAAFTEAASEFSHSKIISITVIGCVQEETDSRGAHYILANHNAPDFVVIGEPGGRNAITLGYRGSLSLDYEMKKPRVHHGVPKPTPAEEAVVFHQSLCELYIDHGEEFGNISLKLTQFNTFPLENHELVRMHLDVRTPQSFDIDDFKSNVKMLKQDAKVTIDGFIPAVVAEKRNELVRAFLGAIRYAGGKPCFKYKTGTSDMNLLSGWGCPIVTYGPGDSSLDHTPEEHLDLEEYQQAIQTLRYALKRLELNTNEG